MLQGRWWLDHDYREQCFYLLFGAPGFQTVQRWPFLCNLFAVQKVSRCLFRAVPDASSFAHEKLSLWNIHNDSCRCLLCGYPGDKTYNVFPERTFPDREL